MIQVRYTECLRSLEQAALDMERKLVAMVAGFSEEVATIVIDNTPIGDFEKLEDKESSYYKLYLNRFKKWDIAITPGYHAGSWRFSATGTTPFDSAIYEPEEAIGQIKQDVRGGAYSLGDKFYITSNGPGIMFLEEGGSPKAPMGIVAPSMAEIEASYKVNLKGYFDRA